MVDALPGRRGARGGRRRDPADRRGARRRDAGRRCSPSRAGSGSTRWSRRTTRPRSRARSRAGAEIIGINNRDLRTFTVDRELAIAAARRRSRPIGSSSPSRGSGRRRRRAAARRRRRRDPGRRDADARPRSGGGAARRCWRRTRSMTRLSRQDLRRHDARGRGAGRRPRAPTRSASTCGRGRSATSTRGRPRATSWPRSRPACSRSACSSTRPPTRSSAASTRWAWIARSFTATRPPAHFGRLDRAADPRRARARRGVVRREAGWSPALWLYDALRRRLRRRRRAGALAADRRARAAAVPAGGRADARQRRGRDRARRDPTASTSPAASRAARAARIPPGSSPSSPPRAASRRPRNSARPVQQACDGPAAAVLVAIGRIPTFRWMVRAVRWESAATGIALVLACGCNARALAPTVDAGRDASSVSTPTTAMGDASARAGGARRESREWLAARRGAPRCGRPAAANSGSLLPAGGPRSARPWTRSAPPDGPRPAPPPASAVGVSCRGDAARVHLPAAGRRRAGPVYTRCASFDVGAARSVAVSPDGRFVALVTEDGLARLVAVELAAGDRGARVASRDDRPRRVRAARSRRPDAGARAARGHAVARVGLDAGLARDAARHCRTTTRPAAASPSRPTVAPRSSPRALTRSCSTSRPARCARGDRTPGTRSSTSPTAGVASASSSRSRRWPRIASMTRTAATVTVLDAGDAGRPSRRSADLGEYGNPGGWRGLPAFRASPVDDLVLVAPGVDDPPGLRAFRLSDGGALPAPAVTAMPLAFMPDGGSVLVTDGGALERVRLADGAVTSVTMLGAAGPRAACRRTAACWRSAAAVAQLLRVLDAPRRRSRDRLRTDGPAATRPGRSGRRRPAHPGWARRRRCRSTASCSRWRRTARSASSAAPTARWSRESPTACRPSPNPCG